MKIVCSAASCKYSSEDEDSSNITFISFPNNDTAAVWAQNCGRPDLIAKPMEVLHTNHYICSDHIEDRFLISKTNPIIIAQGAIPTVFGTPRESNDQAADSTKDNSQSKNVIDSLQLTELINVVNVCQSQTLAEEVDGSAFQEAVYDKERVIANDINFCNAIVNIDKLEGIETLKFTSLCRMCGQSTADGVEIFEDKGLKMGLKEKLAWHTPISVLQEDAMPHKICIGCCEKLEATHLLVATCLRTDMRLRRYLNIIGEANYDSKYEGLVTTCTMEMANEINLNNVADEELSGCNKIEKTALASKFNCKWKEALSNIELEQVEICPIAEPSTDNVTNMKYVVHSDLKNLFQVLRGNGSKNKESSNKSPTAVLSEPTPNGESSRLICLNCNTLFESEELFRSHELMCSSENVATGPRENTEELDSKVVCPACRLSFDDVKYFEKHKKSCPDNWTEFSCRSCGELFANKDDLVIHQESHTKNINSIVSNRRCGHCSAEFNNRKDLQIHIADSHDSRLLFKCSICEKTYEKWSSLDVHEATHRLDKPYLCDLCGKSFKHSNNLRGHKRIHLEESKKKRHVCDICGIAFRSRFHLREHTNQHNGNKPYTCEECGKAFYKRIQLRQHRLSHGSNKYACPICGVTFNRRGNMSTHLKRHSKSEGMYTCSVCEYKCKSMSELKTHRKQHSENEIMESIKMKTADKTVWQCKICDKVFPKRTILLNHERMHTGDRTTVECDKCGKKLANKSSLRYHNKSIHSTERPHMCQFCGEAFVSKEARLIHERIHTGERPYTCKICSMQYRCSSNLSQHMKIHLPIRPHICRYCNKTFTRKGALNVHERIHTGVKPFVCDICSRSFSQKNDMLKHTKIHQTKSTQCEKCDKVFDTKSEILKHLDLHEQSAIQDSIIPEYVEVMEPLESYTLNIQSPSIEQVNELRIVQSQ